MIQAQGSSTVQSLQKWGLAAEQPGRTTAPDRRGGWRAVAVTAFVGVLAWWPAAQDVHARSEVAPEQAVVALAALPPEARDTHRLILSGGPFPYEKDGTVFGNRERLLPGKSRGFYREYTVRTPGAKNRGARRIVCGGEPPTNPEVCYYTADHYASFARIVN